jgi:O-antigen/teichoic acid export membrane protein
MLLANGLAGACFTLVHTPASRMASAAGGKDEYSTFAALLDSLFLLGIPAGGLQAMFAQLAAGAVDEPRRARLRAAARRVLGVVASVWVGVAITVWLARHQVLAGIQIRNPWSLWLTLGVGLMGLLAPVFSGLLQGRQRFFWLGNASIAAGAGRLVGVTLAVVVLGTLAAGALGGVLLGSAASLALAAWASRDDWLGPAGAGDARAWGWVRPWLALTLGVAAGNVMLSADTLFVQGTFTDEQRAFYIAAGRVGRGLVFLTMPLALVLFPRVARSAATGEPTGALRLALGATLGTGVAAAVGCSLLPSLTIRVLFLGNPAFLPAAELVPLFCWCMLPLTAAYTLVNNLLARGRFAAVPWLLLVAGGYVATLFWVRDGLAERPLFEAFRVVIRTLGLFSSLLLAVAIVFSLRRTGGGAAG